MTTGVLLTLRGSLEEQLVTAIAATPGLAVVRRCADTGELLAAALAGLGAVAVVDAELGVDRRLVSTLRTAGTRTLVLCDPQDVARYAELGARSLARDDDVLGAVRALAEARDDPDPPTVGEDPAPESAGTAGQPARIVVVWGPGGSPGRTTVAVNLAAELAAAGGSTLLVDADVWGASAAQVLGVLEESAGLAAAVRGADHGTLDVSGLARLSPLVGTGMRVLAGLPRAARWREIGGASLDVVWDLARDLCAWTVVDAPVLVPDGDAGFDLGPRRNAVVGSALAAADHLVVVGAAEPIGVERLVQALLDLDDEHPGGPPRTVVVNRVRVSAAGPRPTESVREALARFAGVADPVLVPDDRPMCDRALLTGATWREVAPRSPAREAVRDLAERLRQEAGAPAAPRPPRRFLRSR